MKVKFWGVRGSIPVPGPTTRKYGGNTTCYEVVTDSNELVILDAGTGIRELGNDLFPRLKEHPRINVMISHTHWDHLIGFPFFGPAYVAGNKIDIYGPIHYEKSIKDIFATLMDYAYFPVSATQLAAEIDYHDTKETSFEIGEAKITTMFANHPVLTLMYKIEENGKKVVFTGDTEPYWDLFADDEDDDDNGHADDDIFGDIPDLIDDRNAQVAEFMNGADIVIYDCQYTPEEYETKKNWGHSHWRHCLETGRKSGIKRLALTHHEPVRTDEQLDEIAVIVEKARREMGYDAEVFYTREGMTVEI